MDDLGHDGQDPEGDGIEAIGRDAGKPARKRGKSSKATEALKDAGSLGGDASKPSVEAVDRLRSFVERIERMEQERKDLGEGIKEIYAEAKSAGYVVPVLKQIVSLRRKDPSDLEEEESLLDVYKNALGM